MEKEEEEIKKAKGFLMLSFLGGITSTWALWGAETAPFGGLVGIIAALVFLKFKWKKARQWGKS